jgi:hypothetical protein
VVSGLLGEGGGGGVVSGKGSGGGGVRVNEEVPR